MFTKLFVLGLNVYSETKMKDEVCLKKKPYTLQELMNSWSFVYIFFWLQGQTPSSVLKVFCLLFILSLMVSSVILLLDKSLHLLINFLDFYSPLTVRSPALLEEHFCVTAGMQKTGKETWGRSNHYLLSEDASGELLRYLLEPIQFIKSTNYLLLLNLFFPLMYLPLDGCLVWFFFLVN